MSTKIPTEYAEILSELVPPKEMADRYVHRDIHGKEDFTIFDFAMSEGLNILLAGPTGAAKTTALYSYAAARQIPIVNVACHTAATPDTWKGTFTVNDEGHYEFTPTALLLVLRFGGVVVFDEVDRAPHGISAAIHSLTDARRTLDVEEATGSRWPSVVTVHPETLIVGAYNRGYLGHMPLDEAFRNRWTLAIDWNYNDEVEAKLVNSENLRELAGKIRHSVAEAELITPVSTNRLMEFERLCYSPLGWEFACANFLELFLPEERKSVADLFELYRDKIMMDLFELPEEVA